VTTSGSPGDGRTVCRYCDLASAVSHASERECIDELQREVTRLKEQLLLRPEQIARRVIERDRRPV